MISLCQGSLSHWLFTPSRSSRQCSGRRSSSQQPHLPVSHGSGRFCVDPRPETRDPRPETLEPRETETRTEHWQTQTGTCRGRARQAEKDDREGGREINRERGARGGAERKRERWGSGPRDSAVSASSFAHRVRSSSHHHARISATGYATQSGHGTLKFLEGRERAAEGVFEMQS
eukprot:2036605-Rhodomonas_salina.3